MPSRRVFLSIGGPIGDPGGDSFAGILWGKGSISGFLFGPRGHRDFKKCHTK